MRGDRVLARVQGRLPGSSSSRANSAEAKSARRWAGWRSRANRGIVWRGLVGDGALLTRHIDEQVDGDFGLGGGRRGLERAAAISFGPQEATPFDQEGRGAVAFAWRGAEDCPCLAAGALFAQLRRKAEPDIEIGGSVASASPRWRAASIGSPRRFASFASRERCVRSSGSACRAAVKSASASAGGSSR